MPLRPCRSGVRVHGGSRVHRARVTVQVAVKLCCTLAAVGAAPANLQDCNMCCLCCYVFARNIMVSVYVC